jgi:thiol-disulfide isomerase/thioredoxin
MTEQLFHAGLARTDVLQRPVMRDRGPIRGWFAAAVVAIAACGPAPASRAPEPPPPEKTVQLNAPGEPVDVPAVLPAGYVTVVDFWSESCEACATLGAKLEVGVAAQARVVIRKIDVGDGFTPVARAYQIDALPHYLIYDKRKRLRYDLVGGDCAEASAIATKLAGE